MALTDPSPEKSPSGLRRFLPWLGLALAAVAIYDGAVFYSRWASARDAEHRQSMKEAEDARRFLKVVGGDEVKILSFAAYPPAIRAGQRSNLCYGVSGPKLFGSTPRSKKYGLP